MPRSKNFRDYLIERLKDPAQAALYFQAILEESADCDEEEGRKLIVSALKDIADAQGDIAKLIRKTKLERASIANTFSSVGTPKLSTILTIKDALLPIAAYKK